MINNVDAMYVCLQCLRWIVSNHCCCLFQYTMIKITMWPLLEIWLSISNVIGRAHLSWLLFDIFHQDSHGVNHLCLMDDFITRKSSQGNIHKWCTKSEHKEDTLWNHWFMMHVYCVCIITVTSQSLMITIITNTAPSCVSLLTPLFTSVPGPVLCALDWIMTQHLHCLHSWPGR